MINGDNTKWEFQKNTGSTQETINISYRSVHLYTIEYHFNDYELPQYVYFTPGTTTTLEITGDDACLPGVHADVDSFKATGKTSQGDKLVYDLTGLNGYFDHLTVGHAEEKIDLISHIDTSLVSVSELKYEINETTGDGSISFIIKGYPFNYCGIISVKNTNYTSSDASNGEPTYDIDSSGSIEMGYRITIPITLNDNYFITNTSIIIYEKVDVNDNYEAHVLQLEHPFKKEPIVAKVDQHHLLRQKTLRVFQ